MFRTLATSALVLALGLTMAGCSNGTSSGGADSKPLQLYLSGDANQGGGYAKMAAKYKEQTGVTVEIVDIPNSDIKTKVKNAAQADDLPAMARIGAIDPIWKDSVVDLKDIATASKVKMSLAAVDDQGKVLSIPSDVTAVGLFLNTSLWDQAGVAYPKSETEIWTWDEFVARAKQVQAATGAKYGLVMDKSSHRLNSMLFEFGSELWKPDGSGAYATNAATRTGLEYFKSLNDDTFMPKSVWLAKDDPNALFKSGQVAAYYSGSWQIADFAANIKDFQWASVYLPKQPVRATNYGMAAEMVVFDTPQAKPAKDFLAWLYKAENYTQLCEYSGMLPAVDGVTPTYTSHQEAFELYNAEIQAAPPVVAEQKQLALKNEVAGKGVDGDPTRDETVKYLNGEQTVDQTISNISAALTKAYK
ncbi:MAG: extracellular solute-binding protein [Actinomycetia bacterium]|nr:extracellular solute-binding protein [Actinomycetes bacterium]